MAEGEDVIKTIEIKNLIGYGPSNVPRCFPLTFSDILPL